MQKKQVKQFKKGVKVKKYTMKDKKLFPKSDALDKNISMDESEDLGQIPSKQEREPRQFIDNLNVKKWYQEFPDMLTDHSPLDPSAQTALRKEAGAIFEQEVAANLGKAPKTIPRSDFNWIKTVISKGTISDKIAAYVLLIQDNPIINLTYLKNMVSMSKVGKKRECFMTMDTLVELFLDELLPPNRKLKFFEQQPLSTLNKTKSESKRRMLIWFFEDQLKTLYTAFLRALNEAAHDTVEANKERVIVVMHKLLQGHPEQEATLLANIVNKLGDPSHKIGSKVIYTLTKLLDKHPAMKGVVLGEVEKVIFRSNMSKRAQYYSVCFLGQFTFDSADSALANNLISIYFALFKACIKTGDIDSRMMSALLTGVSRAYPFAKRECNILAEHINTVYKVVHLSCANVAIHALSLLYLVVGDSLTDRFMSVLYKKVGEPGMFNAAHHAMFLSIIFKAIKKDTNDGRVCSFIKRLLQVSVHLPVPLICGILILISQVVQGRKNFSIRMEQESTALASLQEDDEDEEECYKDYDPEVIVMENESKELEPVVKKEPGGSSWYHAAIKPSNAAVKNDNYDPYQRNPLHAKGDNALPIELMTLARHFHPTVALFASNIIQGSKISYSGDPLQDFTLIRFLDKFVFKNPKKIKPADEQLTTFARFGRKKFYASVGLKRLRVNTEEYLMNDEKIIPVDETFMYKYLKERLVTKKKKVKKDDSEDDSDVESVGDEEFDDILSKVGKDQKDDLDFLSEIGSLPTGKRKPTDAIDDGEDDELSDMGEGSDDEGDDGEDGDEFGDLDGDDEDLSDLGSNAEEFDGDEMDDLSDDAELDSDLDDNKPPVKAKKGKPQRSKKNNSSGLFASAEEFAELLEDDQYRAGSSSALSNKDNAAIKQLKWETNRDRWVKGRNNSNRPKNFSKGKVGSQGTKRKSGQQGRKHSKKKKLH